MSSVARRSLLTATASGALLGALWFVPSAHSTPAERPPAAGELGRTEHAAATTNLPAAATSSGSGRLADTGGVDTTPYLIGGLASLGIGAGFVIQSTRRSRAAL